MGLIVSELRQTPVGEQELEIVERKGLGHPDHICDAVMNEVSISLSREYIRRYGIVMHHNIDKALLAAGAVRRNFGGGEVKRPMIMGSREGGDLNLTIAMAFVDRLIENENQYFQRKAEVVEDVTRFVKSRVKFDGVNVDINTLDKRGRGMGGIYLTVLGTSADDGDGGQVGRGNRVNGVIPLNRPTCSEAAAGKNPVSHVGKIYNLLTYEIAQHVHQKVSGVREVYVWLLSQIGKPINEPKVAGVELILDKGVELKQVSKAASEIAKSDLNNINDFTKRLTEGKIPVC